MTVWRPLCATGGTLRRFFFFNDTATTEIYTLSLHDALPISTGARGWSPPAGTERPCRRRGRASRGDDSFPDHPASALQRSEEHTSELQSRQYLVCRLLLEKKKTHHLATNYSPAIYSWT